MIESSVYEKYSVIKKEKQHMFNKFLSVREEAIYMGELFSLIPSWADIVKVPIIMVAAAASVAIVVLGIKGIIYLILKAYRCLTTKGGKE